jgi:hypothetical protein
MTVHSGSCLCGTVRFTVKGDFDAFFLCSCRYCQKDTGSAHASNLFSRTAELDWESGSEAMTCFTLPGTRHSRSFCSLCGSALPGVQGDGLLVVPAGCLDTEISISPTARIFSASQASWSVGLEDLPEFQGLPD